MITAKIFAGKTYGVYGLARTGTSVVAALTASGATVLAWDDGEAARTAFGGATTDLHQADLRTLDALIVSPGVPHAAPLFVKATAAKIPVIGDIELFALARPELPPHKVVGITGTNGKSTTTALIHHILEQAGVPTTMGGNIGLPILSQEALPEGGVYVLELSSFQLDLTFSLVSEVAVLLNITPDHLDRHGTVEAYAAAKARLFAMQVPEDDAVIAMDDRLACNIAEMVVAHLVPASASRIVEEGVSVGGGVAYVDGLAIGRQSDWPDLQGPHNAQNAAAAIAACRSLGLDNDVILSGLASYKGLPHRMERVATVSGVTYVNDSKATNPTSTAPALAAYPHIHWIAGGRAKTDELDACAPFFGHVRAAYLIGEAMPVFAGVLEGQVPVVQAGTLAEAVAQAHRAAVSGEVVLLSPACASYDQFKDYEARGDAFRALVGGLE
ncbi:UDP-N-acetylmuramoyl-L-alanine--D-glutamate ligase [Sphingosinicellaceae bacterium]|nr:UDP-N-acetylmuramoyl-L-alanine--D-glutamate ligase [Sphingosinicellaceae bacterium]